ncbi:MAG: hypothetical protein EBR79_00305 [Proteobacteria bacterium]|nr:hypothetical protein [Pseudomonadota bacterium]NBX86398.1 hypothetical protein [Pseudomonadota bacterium]
MVTRIATAFQNQSTLRTLQQANEGLDLSTYQVTTGLKARSLSEIPSDANQLLNLRDVKTKTATYLNNVVSAKNQLNASEAALQQLTDLLADASSTATLARNENSPQTRATLVPKAQSLAESFYTIFKSQYNGTHLFSGSNGAQPPIAGSATATAFPGSPPPTTYYQGDSTLPTVVTGPGTTLQYGVLGNDPTFAQLKAGLEALWFGLQTNNTAEMDNAIATLNTAKAGLSTLLGQVGGQLNTAQLVEDRQTSQQQFLTTQLDDIEKVDVSEAITKFSQQQATLQASMSIIARVNQLSLLDFLR